MYDIRPDRVGWTVYDAETGRPAVLDDVVLVELEQDTAEHVVVLLNRMVYPQRPKRLSSWPSAISCTTGCGAAPVSKMS
jgi:hypothetical protein